MLKLLRKYHKLYEVGLMVLLMGICFSLSVFRFTYSDTKTFLFLNWNLLLAMIPWILSTLMLTHPSWQKSKWLVFLTAGIWLLFFPNAPYILTDLFHLRARTSMPIWFDLVLILSYAWTGLLFGFISLYDMEKMWSKFLGLKLAIILSVALLFVGSFGIYLGRYLRWNSWDILQEPFALMFDIGDHLINPFQHTRAWGMTLLMGVFLNMVYWSFHFVRKSSDYSAYRIAEPDSNA